MSRRFLARQGRSDRAPLENLLAVLVRARDRDAPVAYPARHCEARNGAASRRLDEPEQVVAGDGLRHVEHVIPPFAASLLTAVRAAWEPVGVGVAADLAGAEPVFDDEGGVSEGQPVAR